MSRVCGTFTESDLAPGEDRDKFAERVPPPAHFSRFSYFTVFAVLKHNTFRPVRERSV